MEPYQLNFEGIGPMQLRRSARGEARFIYREVFENLDYEKHGVAIGQGDVVVDAGDVVVQSMPWGSVHTTRATFNGDVVS